MRAGGMVVEGGGLYGCFREQLASRSDFTGDVLNNSVASLFQNGTARMLKAYCHQRFSVGGTYRRGRVALCGLDGDGFQGEFQKTMGDLEHGY